MNAKSIFLVLVLVFAVILGAVFLGTAVGTSDFETLIGLSLVAGALVAFAVLGEKSWILIPIFAAWTGSIIILPIPFSVANIAVGFAVGCWIILILTRKVRWNIKFSAIDVWLIAILVLLGIGYVRNPVGLAAFASGGNVGARPYFEAATAFFGYVLLANAAAPASLLRKLPIMVVVSGLIIAVGGTIAFFLPEIGMYMFQFYSGFMPDMTELDPGRASNEGIGRASFLIPFALGLALCLFASKAPLINLSPFKPLRILGLAIAGILVLLSGFRTSVGELGMYFIIGMLLWWRGTGLAVCAVLAIVGMALIAGVQSVYPLPERVQRPLSFLPGSWDDNVVRSVKVSNEWRFDMWDEILKGNSIKNWWIGDGFGFSSSELAFYGQLHMTGRISSEQLADYFLMTGDLHSGPLSTIKFAGTVGLVLFTILSLVVAWRYAKLWRRMRYSPLGFPIAFYAIVACFFPIKFLFVFGAFQTDLPFLIISAGLLRMFENSAAKYEAEQAAHAVVSAPSETVTRLLDGRPQPRPGALHA
jgi:hypothetical protein